MRKVVKFGGSSLASATQFAKVGNIIKADPERKFVVPSAPGKRNSKDTKVTDMLYACYDLAEAEKDFSKELKKIKERYEAIINGLHLTLSLDDEFKIIEENFKKKAGSQYAASRGEYLNGIIMANYLGYDFVDSAEVIIFNEDGSFDADTTDKLLGERLSKLENAVVPGFYGATLGGVVKLSQEEVRTLQVHLYQRQFMRQHMKTGLMFQVFLLQIQELLIIQNRLRL